MAWGARFSAAAIAVAAAFIVSKVVFPALESPLTPLISASLFHRKSPFFIGLPTPGEKIVGFSRENWTNQITQNRKRRDQTKILETWVWRLNREMEKRIKNPNFESPRFDFSLYCVRVCYIEMNKMIFSGKYIYIFVLIKYFWATTFEVKHGNDFVCVVILNTPKLWLGSHFTEIPSFLFSWL